MIKKRYKNPVYLISAGGTGGHIIPAINLCRYLQHDDKEVLFLTDKRFFNYPIDQNNLTIEVLDVQINYKKKFSSCINVLKSILKTIKIINKYNVTHVVGFGSYTSLVSIIAGFLMLKKTFIHEQNIVIGRANKFCLPFVKKCFLGFKHIKSVPPMFKKKTSFTGIPVSWVVSDLSKSPKSINDIILNSYSNKDRINILVTGGSQGSNFIDNSITQAILTLPIFLKEKLFISHQTSKENVYKIKNKYNEAEISSNVDSFFNNIPDLIATAHLVISRAGAGTIAEICTINAPAILIPITNSFNNHQLENARYCQKKTYSCTITEDDSIGKISDIIKNIINDRQKMSEMSFQSNNLNMSHACYEIVEILSKY